MGHSGRLLTSLVIETTWLARSDLQRCRYNNHAATPVSANLVLHWVALTKFAYIDWPGKAVGGICLLKFGISGNGVCPRAI